MSYTKLCFNMRIHNMINMFMQCTKSIGYMLSTVLLSFDFTVCHSIGTFKFRVDIIYLSICLLIN